MPVPIGGENIPPRERRRQTRRIAGWGLWWWLGVLSAGWAQTELPAVLTITDPLYGRQWHLHNTGQLAGGVSGEDINVEPVWADNNLGAGIHVAVVDNGMRSEHEDLQANVITARNHDYTAAAGEDTTDISPLIPVFSHGTSVAGLIAARDNSLGGRGVAPRAHLYGYNFLRDSTDVNAADAMTRNLDITAVSNSSWSPRQGHLAVYRPSPSGRWR